MRCLGRCSARLLRVRMHSRLRLQTGACASLQADCEPDQHQGHFCCKHVTLTYILRSMQRAAAGILLCVTHAPVFIMQAVWRESTMGNRNFTKSFGRTENVQGIHQSRHTQQW